MGVRRVTADQYGQHHECHRQPPRQHDPPRNAPACPYKSRYAIAISFPPAQAKKRFGRVFIVSAPFKADPFTQVFPSFQRRGWLKPGGLTLPLVMIPNPVRGSGDHHSGRTTRLSNAVTESAFVQRPTLPAVKRLSR